MQESLFTKITKTDENRKALNDAAGIAAGTLVHTEEGLVPIEKVKVGDWVLSKPENGGEQAYKRVMEVCYVLPTDVNRAYPLNVTLNHPFYVVGKGWTAANDLPQGINSDGSKFELHDGSQALVRASGQIYISDQPSVGWRPTHMGDPERPGSLWDYFNHKLVATNVMALQAIQDYEMQDPYLKLPVYNLEVEDFHTYYVGEHDVWVHNENCLGLTFDVVDGEL